MVVDTLDENFRLLRVRLQHEAELPLLLVVGAAQCGDGTTYVACGIARAFAEAGHMTLLLDANPRKSGIADELGITVVADSSKPELVDRHLSVASLFERDEEVVADDELAALVAGVRSRYPVTIIDAPAIPGSAAALQLAQAADGLIVAVRIGRRPSAADHEMKLLLQPGALLGDKPICGLVPTRSTRRRIPRRRAEAASLPALVDVIGRFGARVQTTSN
jgi:Mrp family chromosome partitioning ATPase